jgi:TonB-dependent starch-binding outer membrane protein SusC
MYFMKNLVLIFVFVSLNFFVQAQEKTLTGSVTDAQGNPLPAVNVSVRGTSTGTVTNLEGKFELAIPDDVEKIVISSVGYVTKDVSLNGQTSLQVMLEEDLISLEEVVVTGYGSQKKKDLTGAVSVVDVDEIQRYPLASADQMLRGRISGVNILGDYTPGGGTAVRIRGYSTIRNNDPLYIIDGTPSTTGLNLLNPADIESIQILKDASSASIYGSRAANGVIIVTTKKGKTNVPEVNFHSYVGTQSAYNLPHMLNAQEYGDLLWQAIKNDGGTPSHDVYGNGANAVIPKYIDADQTIPSADVDWVDEIFQNASVQSYTLGLTNGTERSNQAFSVGYFNQDGILKYTGFERLTARLNTDYKLFDRLTIGENITVSHVNSNTVTNNSALGGVIYAAYKFPSISPVNDVNGEFASSATNDIQNPMGILYRNKDNFGKTLNIFGNVFADLEILNGLSVKTNFGLNYDSFNKRNYSPRYEEIFTQRLQSSLSTTSNYGYNWVWSNTLNYEKAFNIHQIHIMGGIEAIENYHEFFNASRVGFPYDEENFRYLDAGESSQTNSGSASNWSLFSYFTKLNYILDERYLLSFTLRRDGTSKLGDNNWGDFPSFSAGWRVSEESFFTSNTISNLKVRFGWGQNGNQDIPPYSTFSSYISNPYYSNYDLGGSQSSVVNGFTQTRVGNPDLKWETTTQTNIGIDIGLINNRIELIVDYFTKNTGDLLLERPLPPVIGGTNQSEWVNAGSMENSGFEFLLNYRSNPLNEFKYGIGINFSAIQNELTELPSDIEFISIPSSTLHVVNFDQEVSRTAVGEPIASFYGYESLGIFQNQQEIDNHAEQSNAQPGDLKFADINNDDVIDDEDRTFIGSPHPDFTYGINLYFEYKGIDLTMFLNGSQGNKIYDLTRYYGDFFNLSAYNKYSRVTNAWTAENPGSDIPRLSLDDKNNNIRPSSYYVFDGSYLRMQNLQLGYILPTSFTNKLTGRKIRVYVQAQNIFTITGYEGLDPEVGLQNYSSANRNLDIGVDRGIYPPSRTFMLGIDLNF